jgi:hypothetical protein
LLAVRLEHIEASVNFHRDRESENEPAAVGRTRRMIVQTILQQGGAGIRFFQVRIVRDGVSQALTVVIS